MLTRHNLASMASSLVAIVSKTGADKMNLPIRLASDESSPPTTREAGMVSTTVQRSYKMVAPKVKGIVMTPVIGSGEFRSIPAHVTTTGARPIARPAKATEHPVEPSQTSSDGQAVTEPLCDPTLA